MFKPPKRILNQWMRYYEDEMSEWTIQEAVEKAFNANSDLISYQEQEIKDLNNRLKAMENIIVAERMKSEIKNINSCPGCETLKEVIEDAMQPGITAWVYKELEDGLKRFETRKSARKVRARSLKILDLVKKYA